MPNKRVILLSFFLFALFPFSAPLSAYVNEFDAPHWSLEGYRPDYFILGNPSSKLSVSFKIRLIEDTGIYFAYSQLMFWDLWADSQPMRDLNYNPEAFYRHIFSAKDNLWLDLGVEHESNGLDGSASRGWNRVYLRYSSSKFADDRHDMFWSIKASVPWGFDSTSLDVARYRGVYEAEFSIRNVLSMLFDRNDVTIRIYPGGKYYINPLEGGQELTIRFNSAYMKPVLPIWVIQFFHGYGENLLDMSRDHVELRIGLGF
jgi:outer membrane phospholipase A